MRKPLLTAALLLAMHCPATLACGVCVEDKIASVYDHAVITRALSLKHQVLFFAIDGRLAGSAVERQFLERAAAGAYGVDAGSARVSIETASLSVTTDSLRAPVAAVERSLQSKLGRRGLTLILLRVMDKPAELKTASRP